MRLKLEELCHNLTDGINNRIQGGMLDERTTTHHAATALGIIIDKVQLLKGKPTAITTPQSNRERARSAIRQFIEEARKMGQEVTEEEAISYLEPRMPEIQEWNN